MDLRYAVSAMDDLIPALLGSLPAPAPAALVARWVGSGAFALTGRAGEEPVRAPDRLMTVLDALARRLSELTAVSGWRAVVDGPTLLAERAAITGHRRQGEVSCGGAARLVPTIDGLLAVSLVRDDDFASVPAWLGVDDIDDSWSTIEHVARRRSTAELIEQAALLGLAVSSLGEAGAGSLPAEQLGDADPCRSLDELVVVDLSSLWAGPLCGRLLAQAGARVIKVESSARPDGARRGPAAFFELMNGGKEIVMLDLRTGTGRRELERLIDRADVVIEASRPRALEQMGIDARAGSARVWLSITGHGRSQPHRIAYGDDAAIAGGLVAYDDRGPMFVADAAADPISGLLGAVAVLDRLAIGGRWLIDLALAKAAASANGPINAPA